MLMQQTEDLGDCVEGQQVFDTCINTANIDPVLNNLSYYAVMMRRTLMCIATVAAGASANAPKARCPTKVDRGGK